MSDVARIKSGVDRKQERAVRVLDLFEELGELVYISRKCEKLRWETGVGDKFRLKQFDEMIEKYSIRRVEIIDEIALSGHYIDAGALAGEIWLETSIRRGDFDLTGAYRPVFTGVSSEGRHERPSGTKAQENE